MPLRDTHAQTSLLYASGTAPLHAVDTVALRAIIEGLGLWVRQIQVMPGEYVQLRCDGADVLVAGFHRPFAMEHFRGAMRPYGCDERQGEVLEMLASHGSSLTVLVMDQPAAPLPDERKARICSETIDLLLATTTPDLVYWSERNELVTAADAEAELEGDAFQTAYESALIRPQRPSLISPPMTLRPAAFPASPRAGNIDLAVTEFHTEPFVIRPRRPSLSAIRSERPPRLSGEPNLSPEIRQWFEGPTDEPEIDPEPRQLSALRSFLALDESSETKRIAETASGRASLYLMSATIAVFALPVGASMLTYNALSGGSFRATSHVMALTGMFLALAAAGMPNPASALGLAF